MFNTYSYKTVPLAGIHKKVIKMKFLQLLQMFYFYLIFGCPGIF